MTDKMFKFYVVFGIFGFWGTMAHDIIPDIVCAIVLVINCIFYLKGERNDRQIKMPDMWWRNDWEYRKPDLPL